MSDFDPFDDSKDEEDLPTQEFWLGGADRFSDLIELAWDLTDPGERSARRWVEAPLEIKTARVTGLAKFQAVVAKKGDTTGLARMNLFEYCWVAAWLDHLSEIFWLLGRPDELIATPETGQLEAMVAMIAVGPLGGEFDPVEARAEWLLKQELPQPELN